MRVDVIGDDEQFAALREDWRRLLEDCSEKHVFMTWEWLYAWWRHFGTGRRLAILTVRSGRQLVGVVPLTRRVRPGAGAGGEGWCLEFLGRREGMDSADWMDVVAVRKAEVLEAVARWLMQRPYWWEWVELRGVPGESSTLPLLREVLGRSGIDVTATPDGVCPYIATVGDWSEYYAARRRVMRDGDVERQVRRLRRLGSLEWVMATRETARAHLEAVFHLHQQRQATLGRPSKFSEEVHRDFCQTLLAICPWEWIDCSALRLNGEIIAAHFGFWYGGRFYYVTPAFDPAYATFSPGKVLLRYLVERCFADESVVECDLLEGTEHYKYQ